MYVSAEPFGGRSPRARRLRPLLGLPPQRARGARSGLSLVEVSLVMIVMLVAISIFGNTVISTARLRELNRENALAAEAARTAIERMLNLPFADRYASYNASGADDPLGAGSAPGNRFAVAGLEAVPEAADGLIGELLFPVVDVGGAQELRESAVDTLLGMPRDLNGDLVIDDRDHAKDYIHLPVLVRLRWLGRSGRREFRVYTQMSDYRW